MKRDLRYPQMPRLHRLSDADPARLAPRMETIWASGDAVVVLPDDAPPTWLPPTSADRTSQPAQTLPEDTAIVAMTSGSTAEPRGIVISHHSLRSAVDASLRRLDCAPGERWALALPVRHIAGLLVILRALRLGTEPHVIPNPGDPHALASASEDCDHVAIVPTQLARAVRSGVDLRGFRSILVGGGPLEPSVLHRAREDGANIVTTYGMTETCGGCVYDGRGLDGIELDIDGTGRIMIRGASVASVTMDGQQLTDSDGWLTTSDLGTFEAGRLHVLGRVDETIISGGVNVEPDAVESALLRTPEVRDALVLGVPDEEWGEVVGAVIVADPGIDPAAAIQRVKEDLGPAAAPKRTLLVETLPRDALGKVNAVQRARYVRELTGSGAPIVHLRGRRRAGSGP